MEISPRCLQILTPYVKFESLADTVKFRLLFLAYFFTRETSVNMCVYYECLNGLSAATTES